MKPIFHATVAVFALVLAGSTIGQYEGEIEIPENVLEAIREFSEREPGTPNEIIVVLDPPTNAPAPPNQDEEAVVDDAVDDVVASILNEKEFEVLPGEPAPHGPEIRVQPLRQATPANLKAADVTIRAPFAAKPIGSPSSGWKLVSSPEVPAFNKNVEVSPGTWLKLSIRPHVLVPDADGHGVYQIHEPGFDSALGYRQESTISSALASSIHQLEEDARTLGQMLDKLEQMLISLPKSANNTSSDN